MLQSSSGQKWKKCEQMLLFMAMDYRGYTSLEVKGRWGLFLPPCLLITAVQQPGTSSPPSRLKRSSTGVICHHVFAGSALPQVSSVITCLQEVLFHRCHLSSHVCRKFNIRIVFKSRRTLCSMLTKVKDTLPPGKQSNVVYRIPCSCGQVYIGETKRRLETRLKEHRDVCERGMMEKSAVAEHARENHHPIHWEATESWSNQIQTPF